MTYQIETSSVFAQKLLLFLQYFRAIRIVPVREDIDENSEAYHAFLSDMIDESRKGDKKYGEKAFEELFQ